MAMLIPVTTEAGLQAFFEADQMDIRVKVKYVGFGDAGYVPSRNQTSLRSERVRVPTASGKVFKEDHIIDLSCVLPEDTPEFWIREIGFFDEKGTLLFVWSSPTVKIMYKNRFVKLFEGIRIKIVDVPFDRIEIVETNPDIKLLYAEEFLNIGIGILNLENTVDFLAQKVENNQNRLDAIETEIVPMFENEIAYVRSSLVPAVREELLSAIIANATALVEVQRVLIEQKLSKL